MLHPCGRTVSAPEDVKNQPSKTFRKALFLISVSKVALHYWYSTDSCLERNPLDPLPHAPDLAASSLPSLLVIEVAMTARLTPQARPREIFDET